MAISSTASASTPRMPVTLSCGAASSATSKQVETSLVHAWQANTAGTNRDRSRNDTYLTPCKVAVCLGVSAQRANDTQRLLPLRGIGTSTVPLCRKSSAFHWPPEFVDATCPPRVLVADRHSELWHTTVGSSECSVHDAIPSSEVLSANQPDRLHTRADRLEHA